MPDRIHEPLHRILQEVCGESNVIRRGAAIEDIYTKDRVLYAPPGKFAGPEALDKFAGDLRATHPHFVYTSCGEAQALHNAGRLAWGSALAIVSVSGNSYIGSAPPIVVRCISRRCGKS